MRAGFQRLIERGFPDHVADSVADLEKKFNDVGGERRDIKGERADLGDVSPQGTMDPTAFDAEYDTQVDRDPLGSHAGAAVGAPTIPFIGISHDLQQLRRVLFKAVTLRPHECRPGPDRGSAVDIVRGIGAGWRMMMVRVVSGVG